MNEEGIFSNLSGLLTDVSPMLEVPAFSVQPEKQKDIFATEKHKGWNHEAEPRCDFKESPRLALCNGFVAHTSWNRSVYGRAFSEIKADDAMIRTFASMALRMVKGCLGTRLNGDDWCITHAPKRRHLERNFAALVAEALAQLLKVPFYEDAIVCHNRVRLDPDFSLDVMPAQRSVILYDDIVTTGMTLKVARSLLTRADYHVLVIVGINNR